jgi:site-specific DNA-methyltransferase (adenine-specific)
MTKIILYNMDVREALKIIPDESVDCVITSPPYWSLRDYGPETETIWDGDEKCEHVFSMEEKKRDLMDSAPEPNLTLRNKEENSDENGRGKKSFKYNSGFCKKCGAWKGQLGLEPNFNLYIKHLCDIFDGIKRVLKETGTCWVNISDNYSGNMGKKNGWTDNKLGFTKEEAINNGVCLTNKNKFEFSLPQKCLCGIPERFMLEMINRGWILRNKLIWYKRNVMPSSAKDRFTIDFENIFFFTKESKGYFFEKQFEEWKDKNKHDINRAIYGHKKYNGKFSQNPKVNCAMPESSVVGNPVRGRNKRCVWDITTKAFKEAHFATFPPKLVETPIKSGCPEFVCNKCGKPREKIFKYNNLKENGHGKLVKRDEPYSVQHREGEILVRDLPLEQDIINYLRRNKGNHTYKEISRITGLKENSVTHWFLDIDSSHGFSYPSKEEWIKLKKILDFDETYDIAMTKEYYKPAGVMDNEYKEIGLTDCGCNEGFSPGIVLDPFAGSGTTMQVARELHRYSIGIEISSKYCEIIKKRLFNGNEPLNKDDFEIKNVI